VRTGLRQRAAALRRPPGQHSELLLFLKIRTLTLPVHARNRNMSAAELEGQEQAMFAKWTESIFAQYERSELNFFEHNLEVRAHRARRVLCRARSSLRRNALFFFCNPAAIYRITHARSQLMTRYQLLWRIRTRYQL
jgi:hypothetical protein